MTDTTTPNPTTPPAAVTPKPQTATAPPKTNILTLSYKWVQADHYRKGRPGPVQSIIVHSTEGTKTGDIATLLHGEPGRPVSVHWYITRDGSIFHMVDDADTAYHAGNTSKTMYSNGRSVGIEHEHIDGQQDWPDAQVQASARLIAFLQSKHGNVPIMRHADVAVPAGRKSDPIMYPFPEVTKIIASLSTTHISASAVA